MTTDVRRSRGSVPHRFYAGNDLTAEVRGQPPSDGTTYYAAEDAEWRSRRSRGPGPPVAQSTPVPHGRRLLSHHGARFASFSLSGGVLLLAGLAARALMTSGLHTSLVLSDVTGILVAVESGFPLSRWLTWRGRRTGFWFAFWRYNYQWIVTVAASLLLYAWLLRLRADRLAVNVLLIVAFAVVNYVGNDRFVFTGPGAAGEPSPSASSQLVSVADSRTVLPPGRPGRVGDQQTRSRPRSRISAVPWPLLGVLAVQAGLSLRLVWSNTAFPDEALYLWAGQLEWQHWLHGTPIPAFATYFSGAPVIYPPIGALANAVGGLAGARLLSLVFMLISNCLLYSVTRRIFDSRSALFASGLYTGLAAAQYLGAFATYDAMALMLICLATWIGVRAAFSTSGRISAPLLMVSAAILLLADATKYAAALFTPVVVAAVALLAWWRKGGLEGIRAAFIMLNTFLGLLAIAIYAGGRHYWEGISYTTLARPSGSYSATFLLFVSAKWEGALVILAVFGGVALIFAIRSRAAAMLACVLAGASLLVPIEQARIGTYTSLFKHIGYGAWFAAILAGYALASLPKAVPKLKSAAAIRVSVATVIIVGIPGIPWAASHYGWPDTSNIMPVMQKVLASNDGPVLADDRGNVLEYYLSDTLGSRQVSGTFFFAYDDPATGRHLTQRAAYAAAIQQRYFAVVFLEFWDSVKADEWVAGDIGRYGGYHLVATIPYRATGHHGAAMIWVRDRSSP